MTEQEFLAVVMSNPVNRAIATRLGAMGLNDTWLVSGALFQTVWNLQSGKMPGHGIRDYDIFYFDTDTSWAAEDRAIASAKAACADLRVEVEVRNQARVHLWYEEKFARPYSPLQSAAEGIDRFPAVCEQVGIRPRIGGFETYTLHGFEDIAGMIVRPNHTPNFDAARYLEKAERWKHQWPDLTILPP